MTDPRVGTVHRRDHGGERVRITLLVVLFLAAAAVISWQFARRQQDSDFSYIMPTSASAPAPHARAATDLDGPFAPAATLPGVNRPVYPYSVIPGGVHSPAELKHDIQEDPVVARQYQGFDFQHARLMQVSQSQPMYVSYRIGQKVYWTRKKIPLHPGETLLTDGKMVVRTRCGNQVAKTPLNSGSPLEPPVEDFEQPYAAMIAAPISSPVLTASPSGLPVPVARNKRWWVLPLFAAPFAGLADPSGSSSSSTHEPLAVTPEPGITLLLVSGMAGVYWRVRRHRKKS